MKKRLLATMLMVSMGTALLMGCGDSAAETDTAADVTEQAAETDSADEAGEAAAVQTGKEKYGIVIKVLSSEFWQTMEQGIKDKAAELGVEVEVLGASSEDAVEEQVTIFETMLQSGEYCAFGVAPLSDSNLVNTVVEANEAGYLVMNIDEEVNADALAAQGGAVVGFVTTDNQVVGNSAGEFIASKLQEGDEVAIIEGKAGATSGEDRKDGCTKAFEAAGLSIVDSQPADWDKTKAYDLATNLISKNENLKAIYCCNDTMAMGAQEAVANSGKDIIVVGTDGNSDAIESVKAGGLTATVAQNPAEVGARSLEMLVEAYRAGQKPGDAARIDERIDPILITIDEN